MTGPSDDELRLMASIFAGEKYDGAMGLLASVFADEKDDRAP